MPPEDRTLSNRANRAPRSEQAQIKKPIYLPKLFDVKHSLSGDHVSDYGKKM